jgi:hypothetical protein
MFTEFPTRCPEHALVNNGFGQITINQHCARVTDTDRINLGKNDMIFTYDIYNGINDFTTQVYDCLINKLQFKVT